MSLRAKSSSPFAWRMLINALACCAFAALATVFGLKPGYGLTSIILLALMGLACFNIVRAASDAEGRLVHLAHGLGRSEDESVPAHGLSHINAAISHTRRRLAEQTHSLEVSRDVYEALANTVQAALYVLEPDGRVVLANRAAIQLSGAIRHLADAPLLAEVATTVHALKPGTHAIQELADGRRVLVSSASVAAAGQTLKLVAIQAIADELGAVEVDAWRRLTQVLSHEVLNSLTAVTSLAETLSQQLAETPRDDQRRPTDLSSIADVIARRSASLMSFISRYRRSLEMPVPVMNELHLSDLFDELDAVMSGLVGDRPIQYRRWGPAASIRLLADHDLLQQAVINLLTNAVEAVSDALDPMISVHCNSDGECLTITIIDNGKGLPSETEEVFVPFYTTKPGGSGIGLSLVRQIAMAHRGTVRAERNGRAPGATFRLVLPVIAKDGGSSTSQPTDTDLIEGDGR